MPDKGQDKNQNGLRANESNARPSDFVLDKVIFSNVFEKDIRRIYIYKKSERLAKAIHLITPAFVTSPSLSNRLDDVAVGLIDAAILPPASAREALSRELLALSSLLSVARTSGILSDMNAELITREAHQLLQEIAGYEEPRLFLDEVPSLAELSKRAPDVREVLSTPLPLVQRTTTNQGQNKGQIKDIQKSIGDEKSTRPSTTESLTPKNPKANTRQDAILAILRSKGPSYIKDISTMIREVSEKTIQRELQALVASGKITRSGDRRWTQYALPE